MALVAGFFVSQSASAQYITQDAFRFSNFDRGGSARFKALGNASTALGGDISSINGNPAGLGFFNSSEFSITPDFSGSQMDATYFGSNNGGLQSSKNTVNFNNASLVFNVPQRIYGGNATKGLLTVNYGIGWNRTNNFNDRLQFEGINPNNNIADMYAERAYDNGRTIDELKNAYDPIGSWAYSHFLIDVTGQNQTGNEYSPVTKLGSTQRYTQVSSGGQNELNLALGANYSNKLYVGGSVGFTTLRYKYDRIFQEDGEDIERQNSSGQTIGGEAYTNKLMEGQEMTGSGFNLKLGVIYRPVATVQIGASFTSPTWYTITDNYGIGMSTDYQNGDRYNDGQNYDTFNYNLRTPLKVSGGLALFQSFGFITADVEYVDYGGMRLSGYDGSDADNNIIKDAHKGAVNARVGAEGRLSENFYLRGGYSYLGNGQKGVGSATNIVSGGLGYRINKFYVDATYSHLTRDMAVYPYQLNYSTSASPVADVTRKLDNVYLTVGFKF